MEEDQTPLMEIIEAPPPQDEAGYKRPEKDCCCCTCCDCCSCGD